MQSKTPSSLQKFKRLHPYQKFDRRGGGVVIPCIFELDVKVEKKEMVFNVLSHFFENFAGTEKLSWDNEEAVSCPIFESEKVSECQQASCHI